MSAKLPPPTAGRPIFALAYIQHSENCRRWQSLHVSSVHGVCLWRCGLCGLCGHTQVTQLWHTQTYTSTESTQTHNLGAPYAAESMVNTQVPCARTRNAHELSSRGSARCLGPVSGVARQQAGTVRSSYYFLRDQAQHLRERSTHHT